MKPSFSSELTCYGDQLTFLAKIGNLLQTSTAMGHSLSNCRGMAHYQREKAETFSLRIYLKDPNTVCPKNPGFPPITCLFQSGWEAGFPKNIRSWILLDQRWVRNFSYLQPSHGGPCGSSFMVAKHLRKKIRTGQFGGLSDMTWCLFIPFFYGAFIHPRWLFGISSIMGSCDIFSPRQLAFHAGHP